MTKDNQAAKKIIVTGGAGFIGSNLVQQLVSLGHSVTVFDNFITGRRDYLKGLDIKVINGDITDKELVINSFKNHQVVFHLAAYGNVIDSINEPENNFNTNVLGTLNILEACRLNRINKLIFSSTGGALMGNVAGEVNENSLPKPISPYGASKLSCEGYIRAYAECYNIGAVIFRFANVYGPNSLHKKGGVNKFFNGIIKDQALTIYGDSARDFIYVSDIVDGLILGLQKEFNKNPLNLFHLSSNSQVKVDQLAHIMADLLNKKPKIHYCSHRTGEVLQTLSSSKLAQKELGFHCKININQGMAKTIAWYLKQFNLLDLNFIKQDEVC